MAYTEKVQVEGDTDTYSLSNDIKKYTLRDLGFVVTKTGSFSFERSLDPTSPYKQGIKLKVTINSTLDGLKMNTVTANGLRKVNIFNREQDQGLVEQYHYILEEFVSRSVLQKV